MYHNKNLDGKTVIITGANCGIGYETALDFAKRNIHTILACRDLKKGQEAVEKIIQETNNKNVELEVLNLSSLKSIREFSERILKKLNRLDILINNAGIGSGMEYSKTEDGFETVFGTNHLGHFYLTYLLLDLIKKSAPSRIINVSSSGHYYGKIDFDNLQSEKNYNSFQAYCNSKLANVLFTAELARKLDGTGVTTVSLHPGVIDTQIFRNYDNHPGFTGWAFWFIKLFMKPFMKDCKDGAKCSIYCALDDDVPNHNGSYFDSDCKLKQASNYGRDPELASKLWNVSCKLLNLPQ